MGKTINSRSKKRGGALLVIIVLGSVIFIMLSYALQTHHRLHKENSASQEDLNKRATKVSLSRAPAK